MLFGNNIIETSLLSDKLTDLETDLNLQREDKQGDWREEEEESVGADEIAHWRDEEEGKD